jgi:hypothetical protein
MDKVLKVIRYKAGYEIRTIEVDASCCGGENFIIRLAYTSEGNYIGTPKMAKMLCGKYGIKPELKQTIQDLMFEKLEGEPNVRHTCCIGFSEKDNKWYGWSHRAMHGFAVGDEVKEGDCCASSGFTEEYLKGHPEEDKSLPVGFKAKSLGDARRMAIAFADSVG